MRYPRFFTFWALLVIVMTAATIHAQSGRRQVKPPPSVPVPTPTPEPTPTPKKEEKEPDIIFLVAAETPSSFRTIPWYFYDAAMQGCARKLRNGSSAGVDVAQRDLSRGEAIKKAKAETKTYVVLLSLSIDRTMGSNDDMQLDYIVLAPTTSKVVTTGRAYINSNRQGPLIVGQPRGGGVVYREQWLQEAGEEAAGRILKSMHLVIK